MKRGVLYRCSIRVVPLVISVLLRGWFATCRINEHGTEHRRKAEQAKCAVALFWHYSLVYVFYHLRKYRAAVLVSASDSFPLRLNGNGDIRLAVARIENVGIVGKRHVG